MNLAQIFLGGEGRTVGGICIWIANTIPRKVEGPLVYRGRKFEGLDIGPAGPRVALQSMQPFKRNSKLDCTMITTGCTDLVRCSPVCTPWGVELDPDPSTFTVEGSTRIIPSHDGIDLVVLVAKKLRCQQDDMERGAGVSER
jgi:hypothetical protein